MKCNRDGIIYKECAMDWIYFTLLSLAGETCVDAGLLVEIPELVQAIREDRPHGELIAIIEDNC